MPAVHIVNVNASIPISIPNAKSVCSDLVRLACHSLSVKMCIDRLNKAKTSGKRTCVFCNNSSFCKISWDKFLQQCRKLCEFSDYLYTVRYTSGQVFAHLCEANESLNYTPGSEYMSAFVFESLFVSVNNLTYVNHKR